MIAAFCFTINTSGAMLSHDNITYSCQISIDEYSWSQATICSYLPLSHVAPHLIDIYMIVEAAGTTFIMDKDALRGTLVSIL